MPKPAKVAYPFIAEVADLFDLTTLSDMEEEFGLSSDDYAYRTEPKFHNVYALGEQSEYSAGIHGGPVTPWFTSMDGLEDFCKRHIGRFREIAATQAATNDYEVPDATGWDGPAKKASSDDIERWRKQQGEALNRRIKRKQVPSKSKHWPYSVDAPEPKKKKAEALTIYSDNDLGQKMEPMVSGPEAGPSNDELVQNSAELNRGSPSVGSNSVLHSPERANVNAIREAVETQAEMEVGKPISQKQMEVELAKAEADEAVKQQAAGLAGKGQGAQEVDAKPGTQIIINVASMHCKNCGMTESAHSKEGFCPSKKPGTYEFGKKFKAALDHLAEPIGGEHQDKITSGMGTGFFGGTDLTGPDFHEASWDYPAKRAAFLAKAAAISVDMLRAAGKEYLNRIRTGAVEVAQGEDAQGFHMVIRLNGREYVLRGQDAEDFRREYAAIPKPQAQVNALVEKYMWKLQPYSPRPAAARPEPAVPQPKIPEDVAGPDIPTYLRRKEREEAKPRHPRPDIPGWLRQKEMQEAGYSHQKREPQYVASKKASYTMRCPWCGGQAVKETLDGTYKCTQCPWVQPWGKMSKTAAAGEQGYEGWSNWETWNVALAIDNDESALSSKHRLAQNALKKGIGVTQLAGQFARLFHRFEEKVRQFHQEQAEAARQERGAWERMQLEEPGSEPVDLKDKLHGMYYEMGGTSQWEGPFEDVNWQEIAQNALDEEEAEHPELRKTTEISFSDKDKKMLKGMGIQSSKKLKKGNDLESSLKSLRKGEWEIVHVDGSYRFVDHEHKLLTHGFGNEEGLKRNADILRIDAKPVEQMRERYLKAFPQEKNAMTIATQKKAGFNFFFPGQVLEQFYPEIQHEIVDYPNATNTPVGVEAPEMTGDPHEIDALVDGALDNMGIVETIDLPADVGELEEVHVADGNDPDVSTNDPGVSTSPSSGMGLGLDIKPSGGMETAGGVRGIRGEDGIRGSMFTEEFYGQYQPIPGASLVSASKKSAKATNDENLRGAGDVWREEFYGQYGDGPSPQAVLGTKVAADAEVEQFSLFLKKVAGEIVRTLLAAFKATSRPLLDKVPGVGEVQLAQIEQPEVQSMPYGMVNMGSRVKYLLEKLTDSEVQDAINDAWSQGAIWNDSPKGGFIYEVFVRMESIDTDTMIAKYKFVAGTRE